MQNDMTGGHNLIERHISRCTIYNPRITGPFHGEDANEPFKDSKDPVNCDIRGFPGIQRYIEKTMWTLENREFGVVSRRYHSTVQILFTTLYGDKRLNVIRPDRRDHHEYPPGWDRFPVISGNIHVPHQDNLLPREGDRDYSVQPHTLNQG